MIPDAENILQISQLFGVSTDYLLHDDYNSDLDLPIVQKTTEETRTKRQGVGILSMGSTVLCTLLLLTGMFGQKEWLALLGILGQVASVIAFEFAEGPYATMLDRKNGSIAITPLRYGF